MLQNSAFTNDLKLQYSNKLTNNNASDADDDLTNDIKYQINTNFNNSTQHQHHQQQQQPYNNTGYYYQNNNINHQISTTSSSSSSSSSSPYGDYNSSSYYYPNNNNHNDYQMGTQITNDNIYINNYAITTKIEIENDVNIDNNGQYIDNVGIQNVCCFTDENNSPVNDYHHYHHHHVYSNPYNNMTMINTNNNENHNPQQQYNMMLQPILQKKFKRKFKDLFEPPVNLNEPNVTTIMQKPVYMKWFLVF